MGKASAASRYRGFRVTVTQHPSSDTAYVTISTKQVKGRWDEWTLIAPAMALDMSAPRSLGEVAGQVLRALQEAQEYLESEAL